MSDQPPQAHQAAQPMARLFATYGESALPAAAGHIQRQEVRRAFYCGAVAAVKLLDSLQEQTDEVMEAGCAELQAELRTFAATLGTCLEGKV